MEQIKNVGEFIIRCLSKSYYEKKPLLYERQ